MASVLFTLSLWLSLCDYPDVEIYLARNSGPHSNSQQESEWVSLEVDPVPSEPWDESVAPADALIVTCQRSSVDTLTAVLCEILKQMIQLGHACIPEPQKLWFHKCVLFKPLSFIF